MFISFPGLATGLVIFFGTAQAGGDHFQFFFRGRDAGLRFFLEGVEDVDNSGEADGIDRAVGVAVVVLDDLEDAGAAEPSEGLGGWVLCADLGKLKGLTDIAADGGRERTDVIAAATDPA